MASWRIDDALVEVVEEDAGGASYFFGAAGAASSTDRTSGGASRPASATARRICTFFERGACTRGARCPFLHAPDDDAAARGVSRAALIQRVPDAVDYARAGLQLTAAEAAASEADDLDEARASWTAACSICMELPARKRKRFGLLNSCDHAFCLQCIREWRDTRTQSRNAVLVCPVCRVLSAFVIPSLRHVTQPERKARLIDAYRRNLKAIDCVLFARGDGVCTFGTRCHYRHQRRAGEDAEAQRLCMGADGTLRVSAPNVTLLDFVATRAKAGPG